MSQEENTLTKLIKRKMAYFGWRAKVLSKKSGVTEPVISRLLNGSVNIGVENIFKLLNALELLNKQDTVDETTKTVIIHETNNKQINIADDWSLHGIAEYVKEHGTGAQYERFRAFGETIRKEIETVKKETSLRSTNVPVYFHQVPQDGLKVVNGGK